MAKKKFPAAAKHPAFRRLSVGIFAALLLAGIGFYTVSKVFDNGSRAVAKKPAPIPVIPVTSATAKKGDIHIYLTGLGTVTALYTATILPQVTGQILQVPFKEGDIVKKGALLVQIDPAPYEATLIQAEGQLARDKALLAEAKRDFIRYDNLAKLDSIAMQQRDDQLYLIHQYEGTVKLDEGLVKSAKVNLAYTRITSPFTGQIGLRLVDPGNVVYTPGTTGIAVITREQPITVIFPVPEESAPSVFKNLRSRKRMEVDVFNRGETQKIATGHLIASNNQVDTSTGTIQLKAIFANKDYVLFPNEFVYARLLLETLKGVTLIPSEAIERTAQGTFVYIVNKNLTVTMRPVKVGIYEKEEVSITEGVSPGDLVVVEGAEKLKNGSRVKLQPQTPSGASTGDDP